MTHLPQDLSVVALKASLQQPLGQHATQPRILSAVGGPHNVSHPGEMAAGSLQQEEQGRKRRNSANMIKISLSRWQ
jgi:hypothetical protein